jgi:hypothetical protein
MTKVDSILANSTGVFAHTDFTFQTATTLRYKFAFPRHEAPEL